MRWRGNDQRSHDVWACIMQQPRHGKSCSLLHFSASEWMGHHRSACDVSGCSAALWPWLCSQRLVLRLSQPCSGLRRGDGGGIENVAQFRATGALQHATPSTTQHCRRNQPACPARASSSSRVGPPTTPSKSAATRERSTLHDVPQLGCSACQLLQRSIRTQSCRHPASSGVTPTLSQYAAISLQRSPQRCRRYAAVCSSGSTAFVLEDLQGHNMRQPDPATQR